MRLGTVCKSYLDNLYGLLCSIMRPIYPTVSEEEPRRNAIKKLMVLVFQPIMTWTIKEMPKIAANTMLTMRFGWYEREDPSAGQLGPISVQFELDMVEKGLMAKNGRNRGENLKGRRMRGVARRLEITRLDAGELHLNTRMTS
jgi:hypothetical protein